MAHRAFGASQAFAVFDYQWGFGGVFAKRTGGDRERGAVSPEVGAEEVAWGVCGVECGRSGPGVEIGGDSADRGWVGSGSLWECGASEDDCAGRHGVGAGVYAGGSGVGVVGGAA